MGGQINMTSPLVLLFVWEVKDALSSYVCVPLVMNFISAENELPDFKHGAVLYCLEHKLTVET
jgi:hypothetical protein